MRTFFVRPDDDLEWVARGDMPVIERSNDFDSAQATQRSIEIAAVGYRVYVRAKQERRKLLGARASTEDVPGRINAKLKACVLMRLIT